MSKLSETDIRQIVAPDVIAREMNLGSDEDTPGRINTKQVAAAITELSHERHISNQSFLGDGIWKKDGKDELTIVQSREVYKWNGSGELEPEEFASGNQVYDIGSERK